MASAHFIIFPTTGYGTTNVSVGAASVNTGSTDRVATVTLTNQYNSSTTLTVRQYGVPMITGDTYEAAPDGDELIFSATTHYPLSFSGMPYWISAYSLDESVQYENGDIIQPDDYNMYFKFKVNENYSFSPRSSTTFTMRFYVGSELQTISSPIVITQELLEFVDVIPSAVTLPASGGYQDVLITTTDGMGWTLYSKDTWINVDPISGGSMGSAEISAGANSATTNRVGQVLLQLSGGSAAAAITVKQLGDEYVDASPAWFNIGQPGDYVQVFVSASTPWSISQPEEDDWYEFEQYSGGSGLTIFGLTISENDWGGPRIGESIFSDPSARFSSVVNIYQDG